MGPTVVAFTVVALAAGSLAGWHARQAHGAHGDIKTYKGRIPSLRKVRTRSALWVIGVLAVAVLVLRAFLH